MVYKVIGLMSGSSLDGLDIAYVHLEETRGRWSFEIKEAVCLPYETEWTDRLRHAQQLSVADFLKLHTAYGHYLGRQVMHFIEAGDLGHKVDFVASHGHTIFHDPSALTTGQIGDGAAIAAHTGLPVISDLRALDVALGGQGAPIVPVGDKLLFEGYDYLLNLGGIANLTVRRGQELLAFDVSPANQALNALAQRMGHEMDEDGAIAAAGTLLPDVLEEMNGQGYYVLPAPKSLSNEQAMGLAFPELLESPHRVPDMLRTMVEHIADQVAEAVKRYPVEVEEKRILLTGGGALNSFLVERLQHALQSLNVTVAVPDETVIRFKEALVMALIGTLRWREEVNVFSSVTGARRDSIGGALWMGH